MTATLQGLPTELLELVARNLTETTDLGAFRLVCREVHDKSLDYFGKEYFTRKQFMVSRFSLQTLIDVTSHPVLSRYLRRIIIGTDHLQNIPIYVTDDPVHILRVAKYEEYIMDQRYMKNMGIDLAMLTTAFTNVRQTCHEVELRDYDATRRRDNRRWRSYGAPTMEKETGQRCITQIYHADTEQALSRTFSVLVAAIHASQLEVHQLLTTLRPLGHAFDRSGLQKQAFYIPDSIRPSYANTFSKLHTLTLCYDADQSRGQSDATMCIMLQFLKTIPSIERLRLNAIAAHGYSTALDLSTVQIPSLRSLELGYTNTDANALVSAASQFPALEYLGCFRVKLATGSWRFVLDKLSTLPTLNSLRLQDIRQNINHYRDCAVGFMPEGDKEVKGTNDLWGTHRAANFKFDRSRKDLKEWLNELKERVVVADPDWERKILGKSPLPEIGSDEEEGSDADVEADDGSDEDDEELDEDEIAEVDVPDDGPQYHPLMPPHLSS